VAGLVGFRWARVVADAVGELRMAFDESVSRLFAPSWSSADLSREPGLLRLREAKREVRSCAARHARRHAASRTGPEVFAASVPGENPRWGLLGATEVLLVDSARDLQYLVTASDGSIRPLSGAVRRSRGLFEVGLLSRRERSSLVTAVGCSRRVVRCSARRPPRRCAARALVSGPSRRRSFTRI